MTEKSTERSGNINKVNNEESFNEPELRFPEFNGIWEEYYLGDICTFSKGKGISKNDITETGIDCIRYGELYTKYNEMIDKTCSKTNLPIDNLVLSEVNDVIIPSTGETAIDISQASCIKRNNVAIGGDINILKSKEDGVFLSYYLNSIRTDIAKLAQGISVIHLYSDQLKILKVNIPSIEEQKRISDLFISLDKKIELMEKKYTIIENYYKSLIHQMYAFNQDKPKITFSNKNWEEISLKDILDEINIKSTENNQYPLLSSTVNGLFLQEEYFDRNVGSKDNAGYKIISKNEIVFSPQNLWMGNINVNDKFEKGIVSPSYKIFKTNEKVRIGFLKHLLKTERMIYEYNLSSEQGASVVRRNLNMNLFFDIKIKIPSIEEQEKISCLMEHITSHKDIIKKEINISKEFKRVMLSKMFC